MIGDLVLKLRRHNVWWWHWCLEFHHNGVVTPIAEGAELTKKKAKKSASAWERVWLRRHGLGQVIKEKL